MEMRNVCDGVISRLAMAEARASSKTENQREEKN